MYKSLIKSNRLVRLRTRSITGLTLYLALFKIVSETPLVGSVDAHRPQEDEHPRINPLGRVKLFQRSPDNFGFQTPRTQQEDQVVIDDSYSDEFTFKQPDINRTRYGADGKLAQQHLQRLSSGRDRTNPTTRTIETAVFLDQALDIRFRTLNMNSSQQNNLVLAIMNQVQRLFRYSSMKIPIKIKLVLVEHLEDTRRIGQTPNPEKGDIDAYLNNFCIWQQSRLDRDRRLWWDHAILLSGLDLYKATPTRNHSGVLGLAWVGGMCKGNYSCTINEATTFESAFVIAHEIGHSLGIMHDGQRNICDSNSYIMSEKTGAGKVHWSRCSNNYLNDSINRQQLTCLESEQSSVKDTIYDLDKLKFPGQVFSSDQQCQFAFGTNYSSFDSRQKPFNAICRELWCISGTWAKAAHPALEGSSCDEGQICLEGKCSRARASN